MKVGAEHHRNKWISDGKPSAASVPVVGKKDANGVQTYKTVQNFPSARTYFDPHSKETFKVDDDQVHQGRVLGRAIPFDNGDTQTDLDGLGWEAVVYTNENNLVVPEHKPDGPGYTPTSVGHFKTAEAAQDAVERAVAKIRTGEEIKPKD
jgi:hypothetical protein